MQLAQSLSSRMAPPFADLGVLFGGFGVHFPSHPLLDFAGPLLGPSQTAQRAELRAVCKALELTPAKVCEASDSACVVQGLTHLLAGRLQLSPSRRDLWTYLSEHVAMIASVRWIKAHLPSQPAALGLGFSAEDWVGSQAADRLACRGAAAHPRFLS